MTEKQDMGVVTQSDREAAVDIYNVILHDWHTQHMLDGMEDECYIIQAFKKHRLASQADQGKIADRIASIVEDRIRSEFKGFWTAEDLVEEIPTMIREAATHPQPSQKREGDE